MKFDVERFKREKISLHARDANEFAEIVRFLKTTDVTIYIADYHAGYGWKVVTVDELRAVEISADAVIDLLEG